MRAILMPGLLLCSLCFSGAGTAPEEGLLEKLRKHLQSIDSLAYHSEFKADQFSSPVSILDWREKGNLHHFSFRQTNSGKTAAATVQAYDGSKFQVFDPAYQTLRISSSELNTADPLLYQAFAHDNYRFLVREEAGAFNCKTMKVADLLAQLEKISPGTIRYEGDFSVQEPHVGGALKAYRFPGGRESFLKLDYTFRVLISPGMENYPVGWQKIDARDRILASCLVEDVKSLQNREKEVWIPGKLVFRYYGFNPEKIYETATHSYTLSVTEPSVGGLEDYDFMIEPGLARMIRDEDRRINIAVPK